MASYVSLAFGRYVVEPFFAPCPSPVVLIKLVSILGVSECFSTSPPSLQRSWVDSARALTVYLRLSAAFVVAVNCWSVSLASRTQVALTFIKMFALVLIIIPGVIALAKGRRRPSGAASSSFLTCTLPFLLFRKNRKFPQWF